MVKILFSTLDHYLKDCVGLAKVLKDRGHQVVFATSSLTKEQLLKDGYEVEVCELTELNCPIKGIQPYTSLFNEEVMSNKTPIEKVRDYMTGSVTGLAQAKYFDPLLAQCIRRCKPDIIVFVNSLTLPAVVNSGIPWVLYMIGNPIIFIDDTRTPPPWSGLGFSETDRKRWIEYRYAAYDIWKNFFVELNKWLDTKSVPPLSSGVPVHHSPHLNIYCYPKEIDYTEIRPLSSKWFSIDTFHPINPESHSTYKLPESLLNKSGPLIYFSMGILASRNLNLMKRLVFAMSKTPYTFIVSKGPLSECYELADNMCGDKFIDPTDVLPIVDVVITIGEGRTVSLCLYYGKPMIVMPVFTDQYNNAQRIHETGYGKKLDPFSCTANQLIYAVLSIYGDNDVTEKLATTSKRMQASNRLLDAAKLIENLKI